MYYLQWLYNYFIPSSLTDHLNLENINIVSIFGGAVIFVFAPSLGVHDFEFWQSRNQLWLRVAENLLSEWAEWSSLLLINQSQLRAYVMSCIGLGNVTSWHWVLWVSCYFGMVGQSDSLIASLTSVSVLESFILRYCCVINCCSTTPDNHHKKNYNGLPLYWFPTQRQKQEKQCFWGHISLYAHFNWQKHLEENTNKITVENNDGIVTVMLAYRCSICRLFCYLGVHMAPHLQ